MLLCCDSHIQAFYGCVQTDSYLYWTQMEGLKVMCWPAYNSSTANKLWYNELHCTGILQGMFGWSARITTLRFDILFAGAMPINQRLTIHVATCLKHMNHNTWQQLLNRNSDKLKKTEDQFLYEIKYYEPFHEDIV